MINVIERPNIKIQDIEFNLGPKDDNGKIDMISNDIGRLPHVEIGTNIIDSSSIILLQLFNDQFLPRLNMKFKDRGGELIDALLPIDDNIIKIFIQSSNDNLMPIRIDFKITQIKPTKDKSGDNMNIIFELDGIMDVSGLYYSLYESFDDTSYNILKKIAIESKLGFASNINNTNDKMVWVNPALSYMEFIQTVVNFSYISQDTFLYSYIDFYYNLNYIDIETALSEDISNQKALVGNKYSRSSKNDKNEMGDLMLTNNPNTMGTNSFIDTFSLINRSTAINLEIGYTYYMSYYDTQGNTVYDLILDTISTPGIDNNGIIMKGRIGEVTEIQQFSNANSFEGKVDTDNVHNHFLYAYMNNKNNLMFLQKVKLTITINIANFNLYRYQKIYVSFFNPSKITENDINGQAVEIKDKLNQRLTGEWLITSINYNFNTSSGFEQEVTLVKRELSFNDNDFNPNKSY